MHQTGFDCKGASYGQTGEADAVEMEASLLAHKGCQLLVSTDGELQKC